MSVPEDEPPSYHASLTTPLQPAFSHASTSSASRHVPLLEHSQSQTHLPSGFFLLRSRSPRDKGVAESGRTFDVLGRKKEPGSEIGLHPIKKPYLPSNNLLMNQWNNQVLYVDWNGHLCSASAEGRALDCIDGRLMLAASTPIFAIPSRSSHPLPQFHLSPHTNTLHVRFPYDPTFPGPSNSTDWQEDDYIVEAVPVRKPKVEPNFLQSTLLSGLGEKFGQFGSGFFGKSPVAPSFSTTSPSNLPARNNQDLPPPPPPAASEKTQAPSIAVEAADSQPDPEASASSSTAPLPSPSSSSHSNRDLPPPPRRQDPDSDDDGYSSDSSDDDPEAMRPLRVIRLPRHWREKFPAEALSQLATSSSYTRGLAPAKARELRQWRRRQWDAIPVVVKQLESREPILPLIPTNLPFERQLNEARNTLLGGNRIGAPSPLTLAPPQMSQHASTSSPPGTSSTLVDDEDEDILVNEELRSSRGLTPATGNSWTDARELASAEITKLSHTQEESEEDEPKTRVDEGEIDGAAREGEIKGKGKGKEVEEPTSEQDGVDTGDASEEETERVAVPA